MRTNCFNQRTGTETLALIILCSATILSTAFSAKNKDTQLFFGEIVAIEETVITVKPHGKDEVMTLPYNDETEIRFECFASVNESPDKPIPGHFIKFSRKKSATDEPLKQFTVVPSYPEFQAIENKHQLSTRELFEIADTNEDEKVNITEFATHIFQSHKHLHGKFRKKGDKDGDGFLSYDEFSKVMKEFKWFTLSRKSAMDWYTEADKDGDSQLTAVEAKGYISGGHGNYEKSYTNVDKDGSGGLSFDEFENHYLAIVTGPQKQ